MKVLFDNVILNASLSSGDASPNYPVTNLISAFLEKRFQHEATVYDTVTITLAADSLIDCVFVSYSNAGIVVIRLYDRDDVLLDTQTIYGQGNQRITTSGEYRMTTDWDMRITEANFDIAEAVHFSTPYNVASIQVDVYGGDGGYLGAIAAGLAVEFPDPLGEWSEPWIDNSDISTSRRGQSLQNYIKPLRTYAWTFRDITRAQANTFRDLYLQRGVGARVWIDPFEGNHDFMRPMYARIDSIPDTRKNGVRYDMQFEFTEVR